MAMMDWILSHLAIVWLILAILFAIIEGLTLSMITIWFTIGSLAASIVALVGGNIWIQFICFVAVSVLLIIFTRPILVKKLKLGREKNSMDQMAGKYGVVIEPIRPFASGQVKVGGIVWTAIGEKADTDIEADCEITVIRVEGVKLIVKPRELENENPEQ